MAVRRTYVIGFDYGAHASKVVIRQRGSGKGQVVGFDARCHGYQPGTSPSLVRVVDGRLYFGSKALKKGAGKAYPALKAALLPENKERSRGLTDRLGANLLVAAYLTWAFRQLATTVTALKDARLVLNLAAPMSHFENAELKTEYLAIVHAAWDVGFEHPEIKVKQGMEVKTIQDLLIPRLHAKVPADAVRPFAVLPETIAPIVSLSLDPLMATGMYMIVDCGAATTEMSIFHVDITHGQQRILCYADETLVIGANDFRTTGIPAEQTELSNSRLTEILRRQHVRVWYQGFRLDKDNRAGRDRWHVLRVVLSGGGTMTAPVELLLNANLLRQFSVAVTQDRHRPGSLTVDNDGLDLSFFANANGLAMERAKWPVTFHPQDLEPLAPDDPPPEKPPAYWYQE